MAIHTYNNKPCTIDDCGTWRDIEILQRTKEHIAIPSQQDVDQDNLYYFPPIARIEYKRILPKLAEICGAEIDIERGTVQVLGYSYYPNMWPNEMYSLLINIIYVNILYI